jgi:uncharacterized membrane protein
VVALRDAKTIGAIGAILVLAGLIPNAGVLSLVGLILVIVGVKYIGDLTGDRSLYGNMISFVTLSVVGSLVGALVVFVTLFSFGASTVFSPFRHDSCHSALRFLPSLSSFWRSLQVLL